MFNCSVLDFFGVKMAHETPSGGLRLIVKCTRDFTTLKEHIEWFHDYLDLSDYGKLDTVVNDLSRASFMVKKDWMIYLVHVRRKQQHRRRDLVLQ